jgi:hypothetical protein
MHLTRLFGIIIFALFMVGCSLPKRATLPTETPDLVATKVRQLLTAAPTQTISPDNVSTNTPASSATSTAVPTTTLTTTPVGPNLGQPTWEEKFTANSGGFLEMDNGHTRIQFSNGGLQIAGVNADGWRGWSHNYRTKALNFYIEIAFNLQNCSGTDEYGITFRSPDYNQGYFFGFSCDGKYRLSVWDGENLSDLIKWTANPAIPSGGNQTNRMGIKALGSHYIFYANGKQLQEIDDTTFTKTGTSGIYISSNNTPGFTVKITDLSFWNLP